MLTLILVTILLIITGGFSVHKRWLTLAGAFTMVIMGDVIEYAFHVAGIVAIFLFFILSNLITLVIQLKQQPIKFTSEPRTLSQVLANGGGPMLAALGQIVFPSLFWLGFYLVSIAEATADTWASEVGSKLGRAPFHLRLNRRVPKGLSGAMTRIGSLAGFIGSLTIALYSLLLLEHWSLKNVLIVVWMITLFGWLGQFIDTILGAYVQARYRCEVCATYTDKRVHCCGQPTRLAGGWRWMTNSVVNGLSSLFAGLIGGSAFLLWIN